MGLLRYILSKINLAICDNAGHNSDLITDSKIILLLSSNESVGVPERLSASLKVRNRINVCLICTILSKL